MNLDLMSCSRMTAGIIYPPATLERNDLTRLYAQITEQYSYESFSLLPDGARLSHQQDDLVIQETRAQINESVQVHFNLAKEKVLDLFQTVTDTLNLHQFLTFGLKLIALVPTDDGLTSSTSIEKDLLHLDPVQLDLLGPGRRGIGLRVNLSQNSAMYDLRIEPFFRDLSQIYIELDAQFPQPFTEISGLEQKMDQVYQYLFKEVKSFLGGME